MDKPEVGIVFEAQAIIRWMAALDHPFCPCRQVLGEHLNRWSRHPCRRPCPCFLLWHGCSIRNKSLTDASHLWRCVDLLLCTRALAVSADWCAPQHVRLHDTYAFCSGVCWLRTQRRSVADCCGGCGLHHGHAFGCRETADLRYVRQAEDVSCVLSQETSGTGAQLCMPV